MKENNTLSFRGRFGPLFYSSIQWKYVLSVGVMMVIVSLTSIYLTITFNAPDGLLSHHNIILTVDAERNIKQASVKIDLLDPSGNKIQTIPGIVIDVNGLVLTNLSDLNNADSARVNFKDGTTLPVVGVQTDEKRNLAILKISQKNLVSVKVSGPKGIQVGDRFLHISDPTDPSLTANHVTVTHLLSPQQNDKKEQQFIQITSQKPITQKGILVNSDGETIGKVINGEGMVGSAVTFDLNEAFAPSENFIPISLIGK
ncbi:MAG: trypsin-like peptidase domain-containing protein [Nitrospirae bacterium]|nr:trypsin-like peptidase domain-containing protein [Nitrospirota bacterium]